MKKLQMAIFASGAGSNALNLIQVFKEHPVIDVAFVLSNKSDAAVVQLARQQDVEVLCCTNDEVAKPHFLSDLCVGRGVDMIALAGFLRQIPPSLIHAYPNRIINIHPSLLPAYGGKGMYGRFVHEAVLQNRESKSGISIHLVNEVYDDGKILDQFSCTISSSDNIDSLQQKIHALEMCYFPKVLEEFAQTLIIENQKS